MLNITAPLAKLAGGSPVVADITEGLPAVTTDRDPVYSEPFDLPAGTYAIEVRVTNTGSSGTVYFFTIRLVDPTGAEVERYVVPAHSSWLAAQAVVFHPTITAPGAYRISMQTDTTSSMYGVGHIDRIRVIRTPPGAPLRVGVADGVAYDPLRNWAVSIGKTYATIEVIPMPVEVVGPSLQGLFYECSALTSVPDMDTSQVTNMKWLFYGCRALTAVPELDTSNITEMYAMFRDCSSLTSLPEMDTSNVTSMYGTFFGCSSLTSVPDLDSGKVTTMYGMFYECSSLTSVPALDSGKVTDVFGMFTRCTSLESVTLPGMGNGFTAKQTLHVAETKLNATAADALMESLGTPPAGGVLQLPATAAGANTGIATAKNWEVSIG